MGLIISLCLKGLCEMARRVLRVRRPQRCYLLDLPADLIHTIARVVGHASFGDLCRLRATCRDLRGVADNEIFYRDIDLWVMQTPNLFLNGVAGFKEVCLENQNPSAIFLRGCWQFFRLGDLDGGLASIHLAAVSRYDLAMYAYACLVRILHPNVNFQGAQVNLSRDFVRAARKKVQDSDGEAWPYVLPQWFSDKIDEIDVNGIYKCRCTRNRTWARAWDERVKKGEMCDDCFWKIHMLGFCHDFPSKVCNWPQ